MTILWESTQWSCNRCGTTMKYRDPKLVMADADGSGNLEKLDVHICDSCRSDVIDFANGKESEVYKPKDTVPFLHGTVASAAPLGSVRVKYPTMKQLIKDSKKKQHEFYGNQHKKVVRK